jgi:hypothetical protein
MQEKFENIKGEIRSRKLQKGRQYNGQNEKGQKDKHLHRKLNIGQYEPY